MWSNRRTLVREFWLLGLTLALGCSGKTVNNSSGGSIDTLFEAGVDAAVVTTRDEAGVVSGAVTDSLSSEVASSELTGLPAEQSGTTSAPTTGVPATSGPTTTSAPTSSTADPDTTTGTGFWRCFTSQYGDGVCDCGCGIRDIDCAAKGNVDLCENCDSGCNASQCPGRIDPEDTTQCVRLSPLEWTCNDAWYDDGNECHCGCGAIDPDCEGSAADLCQDCNVQGSCSNGNCPGSIDPNDNSKCWLPDGWTCFEGYFGDGICTCGCGAQDVDCSSLSADACQSCIGCNNEGCPGTIDATDNRICTGAPYAWRCEERYYNDGQLCNCGCGVVDPDCESADIEACDVCDFNGSCSKQDCPGTIDPTSNAFCEQPEAPPDWTCSPWRYGDGYYCDCGCGVPDLDCITNEASECQTCCDGQSCPRGLNPDDVTECLPVPEAWTCGYWTYGDGYCDCGCGVTDLDCEGTTKDVCLRCLVDYSDGFGGCSNDGSCDTIAPDDNAHCIDDAPPEWTCDERFYADGDACDCGCGALDADCEGDASRNACDICNASGSCSTTGCNNNVTIDVVNNAQCVGDEPATSEPATSEPAPIGSAAIESAPSTL
jgi:hypothetical protein